MSKPFLSLLAIVSILAANSQTDIYVETFPSTMYTTGGWSTSGDGSSYGNYQPSQLWLHDMDGTNGFFETGFGGPLLSQTAADGFAILDGDFANGAGVEISNPIETIQANLVSPVYDLSGNLVVQVVFTHDYRLCCSAALNQLWLEVSIDGFSNISGVYPLSTGFSPNVYSGVIEELINVSSAITGNPSTVQFRFRWGTSGATNNASHYFWKIDDFKIQIPPIDEQKFINDGMVFNHYSDIHDEKIMYSKIPQNQITGAKLFGTIANLGINDQAGTQFDFSAFDDQLSLLYSQSSPTAMNAYLDTLTDSIDWSVPNQLESYKVIGNLNYTNIGSDADLSNNLGDTLYFEVTEGEYGKDGIEQADDLYYMPSYGWVGSVDLVSFGNSYVMTNPDTLRGIKASFLDTSGIAMLPVKLYVWEINGSNQNLIYSEVLGTVNLNYATSNINDIKWQYFVLNNPLPLVAGEEYIIAIMDDENWSKFTLTNPSDSKKGVVCYRDNGIWEFGETDYSPAIRLLFNDILSLEASIQSLPSCFSACDGILQASTSGSSTSVLSYQWYTLGNSIPGANSANFSNACVGEYQVRVQDTSGIELWDTLIISTPTEIVVTETTGNETCDGSEDGFISINISGGILPYQYNWSNGNLTAFNSGLAGGSYNLNVTDGAGCSVNENYTLITNPYDAQLGFVANNTSGSPVFNVTFENQTPNLNSFNFNWNFGDGGSILNNSNFVQHAYNFNGNWTVSLISQELANGCFDTLTQLNYIFTFGGTSCSHNAVITGPTSVSTCASDSLTLDCNSDPSFSYQWYKNGNPISGQNSEELLVLQSGNYNVVTTQNACPVVSNTINVTVDQGPLMPNIFTFGSLQGCGIGVVTLDAGLGYSSYLWNTGETTQIITTSNSGDYWVVGYGANGCGSVSATVSLNASNQIPVEICIVGIDSLTGFNRVVWEKPITTGIDSFYVYKETNQAHIYTKIGAVDYNSIAMFIDVNSTPAMQAYRYKISTLDTCGIETNQSNQHKSIHLTINQGMGQTWNLIWSHYEGITFPSYNLYSGTNSNNMTLLTTISSTLNSFTDLSPPAGNVYYQIEVVHPTGCNPLKAGYDASRSNIIDNLNLTIGLNENENEGLKIYPNPTKDIINIDHLKAETIELIDFTGRKIYEEKSDGKITLDLSLYETGVYFIRIGTQAYRVIKH